MILIAHFIDLMDNIRGFNLIVLTTFIIAVLMIIASAAIIPVMYRYFNTKGYADIAKNLHHNIGNSP